MAVHQHNPHAEKVLPYSKSPFARLRLLGALRSLRPDLVVALRLNEDAVPLGYLANRRAFVGWQRRCKSFLSFCRSLLILRATPISSTKCFSSRARPASRL
jgi:ADP-heptose:LPS heptosyltransferase